MVTGLGEEEIVAGANSNGIEKKWRATIAFGKKCATQRTRRCKKCPKPCTNVSAVLAAALVIRF